MESRSMCNRASLLRRLRSGGLLLGCLFAVAATASASDGALEIDASCVAAGCFPGDTPGFPVQTQADASYVLTSSLVVGSPSTMAVLLADGASLDMHDFTISSTTTCSGDPVVCTNVGTNTGVQLGMGSAIRNGTVRGFGQRGLLLQEAALVENMHLTSNGDAGLYGSATGSVIRHCRIHHNGGDGMSLGWGAGSAGSVIVENAVFRNGARGISVASATILGNAIYDNVEYGIYGFGTAGYGNNNLYVNNGGNANPQVSGGDEIGHNLCGGDATCP